VKTANNSKQHARIKLPQRFIVSSSFGIRKIHKADQTVQDRRKVEWTDRIFHLVDEAGEPGTARACLLLKHPTQFNCCSLRRVQA
jgi:hypothetical protein